MGYHGPSCLMEVQKVFWFGTLVWIGACVVWNYATSVGEASYLPFNLVYFVMGEGLLYGLLGINVINEWNRRPVMFFGRYSGTAGPGLCFVDPAFHYTLGDVLVQDSVDNLSVNNVQTHDNVRLNILGVLTTRIHPDNVKRYIVEIENPELAVRERANAAVTEVVGKYPLDYILGERQKFSGEIQAALQEKVVSWGIEVKAVEIKDFKIADPDIERSIAMKARAEKEAQAELRRAEMQKQIAEKLREAAASYDDDAWRLKSIETLIELCRSAQNNTIIIPSNLTSFIEHFVDKTDRA